MGCDPNHACRRRDAAPQELSENKDPSSKPESKMLALIATITSFKVP
jgi:hypothetical protein